MDKPKYQIGDKVVNIVEKRGSGGPSTCVLHTILQINGVRLLDDNTYQYECGYDGYLFQENELVSLIEYREGLI